jgi:predicted ester cyclase
VNLDDHDAGGKFALSRRDFAVAPLALYGAAMMVVGGAGPAEASGCRSGETSNARIVRQVIERGYNQGDLTIADEVMGQRHVEHEYQAKTDVPGPEILKIAIVETRKAFNGMVITIEDLVESDNKVWIRSLYKGIDSATGKPFSVYGFDTFRFENGKMVEHWGVPDRYAIMHQVGLIASTSR